jgi:hypothetical protein
VIGDSGPRAAPPARWDVVLAGVVGGVLVVVEVVLRDYLTRPFWYDEIWRAHFVSEPASTFWSELSRANTPSAAGWMALSRLAGDVFGWHGWALRLSGFAAYPLLGAGIYVLARRFTGRPTALVAALWVCLNGTLLDLGTQLKPYTVETLAGVIVTYLWIGGPGPDDGSRGRLVRRTAAGLVALFAVPLVFLVVPLAAAEVALGPHRRRRATEALPALVLTAAHTVLFVGHQSSQRIAHYWDRQFLADRDLGGAVAFVGRQLWDIVTGNPPGIDRYDPSLVHATTDGSWAATWLMAPAFIVAGAVGSAVLLRRRDGRLVLAALGGAELLMLAASAERYWPFGPTRTNLFVVPLLVLLVVTGAATVGSRLGSAARAAWAGEGAGAKAATAVPTAAVAALLVLAIAVQTGSAAPDRAVWNRRDRTRGLDLMVDAAVAARRLHRVGDLVIVGGRLVRPGWIYAMEASDDAAVNPAGLPPAPAGTAIVAAGSHVRAGSGPPRVARADTVFLSLLGDGTLLRELRARTPPPRRLLVFIFDADRDAVRPDLADVRRSGWCAADSWTFDQTGTLTVFNRCG